MFDPEYRREVVRPNPLGKLHRSWTGMYRAKGKYLRPIGELPAALEGVHPSVRERHQALPDYRPANLERYFNSNQ